MGGDAAAFAAANELVVALGQRSGATHEGLRADGMVRAALDELVRAGRAAFPDLVVTPAQLGAHVGGLVEPPTDAALLAERLRALPAADLHLACACAEGVAGAAETFNREQLARVPGHLARLRPDTALVD